MPRQWLLPYINTFCQPKLFSIAITQAPGLAHGVSLHQRTLLLSYNLLIMIALDSCQRSMRWLVAAFIKLLSIIYTIITRYLCLFNHCLIFHWHLYIDSQIRIHDHRLYVLDDLFYSRVHQLVFLQDMHCNKIYRLPVYL